MSEILDFPEKKTCGNCNRFESCFAQSNALMGITVVAPWMVSDAKECPACCQWVKEIPMPNFNSSEVVERLSDVLNMHDHVRPGGDRLSHAAAILDSALLAAHPEAGELAGRPFSDGSEFVRRGLNTCDDSETYREAMLKKGSLEIAAALESAKREAEPKWISVKDRLPEEEGRYLVLYQYNRRGNIRTYIADWIGEMWVSLTSNTEILYWMPIKKNPVDSLVEKEVHQ